MRVLHKDYAPIAAYLAARDCRIRRLEWDLNPQEGGYPMFPWTVRRRSAHPPTDANVAEIEDCFHRADKPENAGTVLHDYFHINAPPSDRPVSLGGAVEHVEAYGGPDEFLLVGYHDGGLISVSRSPLPFQAGLPEATWWGP